MFESYRDYELYLKDFSFNQIISYYLSFEYFSKNTEEERWNFNLLSSLQAYYFESCYILSAIVLCGMVKPFIGSSL